MELNTKEYLPDDIQIMTEHIMKTYQLSIQELKQLLNVSKDDYQQFLSGSFHPDCYMKLLVLHTSCIISPEEKLRALIVQIKTETTLSTDVIAKLAKIPETALLRFLEDTEDIDVTDQCRLYATANTLLSIFKSSSLHQYKAGEEFAQPPV